MKSLSTDEAMTTNVPSHKPGSQYAAPVSRSIHRCDFRAASLLSNEDARALTGIHEAFAANLSSALDIYLGTSLETKLQSLDRLSVKDHVTRISQFSYNVVFSFSAIPCTIVVECDMNLVLPMIELLMGGEGNVRSQERELSEIDEETIQYVLLLIVRQAEAAWHLPEQSLITDRCVKSALLNQFFPANEKVTVVNFELMIAEKPSSFRLVFPTVFAGYLMKQIKLDQPQKKGAIRHFPTPPIRERILDCDMEVATELIGLRVTVRDLIALQPGSVLKLRAPVQSPAMLTAGGHGLFEAVPVRNGSQRAAQLGRRVTATEGKRG